MSPANATTTSSGRMYVWPVTGEKFWSVTTILSAMPKPALPNWAAKSVAEFAVNNRDAWDLLDPESAVDLLKRAPWRQRDKAADLGTLIHEAIDNWAAGRTDAVETADLPDQAVKTLAQFVNFLECCEPEFLHTEATVYNRSQRYAGTFDGIVKLRGQTLIIDHKTGSGVYPEMAMQLAAYANAEFVGLPTGEEAPMPTVEGGAILHLRPDKWQLVPVRIDDDVYRSFLYVREVYRFQNDISKSVVGWDKKVTA